VNAKFCHQNTKATLDDTLKIGVLISNKTLFTKTGAGLGAWLK
jgi:hypothetical protein